MNTAQRACLLLLLIPPSLSLAQLGATRVTVEQLEPVLGTANRKLDGRVARQLAGLELTERMSNAKLSSWERSLHGEKTREALVALADVSVFLDPPAAEIPPTPPPDQAAQRLIVARAVDYIKMTAPELPNFIATRATVIYEQPPQTDKKAWVAATGGQPLQVSARSTATVLYRNGRDIVDAEQTRGKNLPGKNNDLTTKGTFGPILVTVFDDLQAARGELTWSRWEKGAAQELAVFRYAVPKETSHYAVNLSNPPNSSGLGAFRRVTGYHGEVAIDPVSGVIVRVTVQADLNPPLPILRADILVEYGPVVIGGKTYVCPVKSVSILQERSRRVFTYVYENDKNYVSLETILSDAVFADYHMFRAEAEVLPDFSPDGDANTHDPGSTGAPAPTPPAK
jgi:hypothetical protein